MTDYKSIKAFGREIMERYGWKKLADFNSNRRVTSDWVDQVWIHPDGLLVLIEEKYGADALSHSQEWLWARILAYAPKGVFYAMVSDEESWERLAAVVRQTD